MSTVEIRDVAAGVWTAAAGDYRALVAEGDSGLVVAGTLGDHAAAFAAALADRFADRRVTHLIHAIDHLDHTRGADVLAPEAEVVAHELCARAIAGRGSSEQRVPTRVVRGDGERLTLDGVDVQLHYRGPSVGTGGLVVQLPAAGVVYLVGPRADARYGLFGDFHFRHVRRVWREVAALDGVTTVVPGRGDVMDPAGLLRAADYLDALHEASQQAFADGVAIWEIESMEPYVADRLRERFGDLGGFDRHIGIASIRAVHFYLMGGWGLEDTSEPERLLAAA